MGLQQSARTGDAAPTVPVLAAEAPGRWTPSIFGVVPQGSVRRRPRDAVQLVLALGVVAGCALLTDGFTARDDRLYRWLAELTSWVGTVGTWLFVSCTVGAVAVVILALRVDPQPPAGRHPGRRRRGHGRPGRRARRPPRPRRGARGGRRRRRLALRRLPWCGSRWRPPCCSPPRPTSSARPGASCARSRCWPSWARCSRPSGPSPSILAAVGLGWADLGRGEPRSSARPRPPRPCPRSSSALDGARHRHRPADPRRPADLGRDAASSAGRPTARPASVVVIGRDAADARLFSKISRSMLYRDAGPTTSVSRVRAARAPGLPAAAGRQGGGAGERGRPRRHRRAARTWPCSPCSSPTGTPLAELDPGRSPTPPSTTCGRSSPGSTPPAWPTVRWSRTTSWSGTTGPRRWSTSPTARPAPAPSGARSTGSTCW